MVKKALLIGINYNGTDAQLNGCINDIKNINTVLTSNCAYQPSNIRVLTEVSGVAPTRANIESNIRWLVDNCLPGDTLFFYYSGHGAFIKDNNGDEADGNDEVIVPLDYQTKGVITDDWLFSNMVEKIPTNVTLWAFTDCCHSGTMIDLKYNYRSMCELKSGQLRNGMTYNPNDWTDKFAFSMERSRDVAGNVYLFSGCQEAEKSADAFIARQHQGAFSFCLLELIQSNLTKMSDGTMRFNTGRIKLRNILKEVNCRLDINGYRGQNSQLSMSKQSDLERTFDP